MLKLYIVTYLQEEWCVEVIYTVTYLQQEWAGIEVIYVDKEGCVCVFTKVINFVVKFFG